MDKSIIILGKCFLFVAIVCCIVAILPEKAIFLFGGLAAIILAIGVIRFAISPFKHSQSAKESKE